MERLTELYDGEWCLDLCDEEAKEYSFHKLDEDGRLHIRVFGPAVDRLSVYEDTGLTPEEVIKYCQKPPEPTMTAEEIFSLAEEAFQRVTGLDADQESAVFHARVNEAVLDDRLVILPCKVGDRIYRIEKGGGVRILASHVVEKIEIGTSGTWICFGWRNMGYETVRASEIGKTIFLTPHEGEAAMKGAEHGSNV